MARTNQVPEGAKDFAGKHFLRMVEETLSENPSEYGFKEGKGSITLSELYPVYSLNADFAFGQSDEIIADHQTSWVAVIFQDGQPVRAIGTYQRADGQFALEAIGYAPELPNGLLSLKDDEKVIYFFPDETYYVYSEKANTIMKLERAGEKTVRSSPQSKEEFQNMLIERFKNRGEWPEDASGGFMGAAPSALSPLHLVLYLVMIVFVLGGTWLYFRRRLKTRN